MKKITMIALAVLTTVSAGAQTIYDAANIAQKDLNGTARFVGMGGAMGALGGDISTIGTNPAGIGIYRSNDAMLTFGYSMTGTESKYLGNKFEENKSRWNFDNAGFVLSTKIGNQTSLRYVNFGFNYHKTKSFYKNMSMAGALGTLSQTYQMAAQADGCTPEFWESSRYNHFNNPEIGWLSALGYNGYLISPEITTKPTDWKYTDDQGNQLYDENGAPLYENYDFYTSVVDGVNNANIRRFRSQERGGIDQYDFNVSFNVNDRFYFGVTVGAYDVNYWKSTLYDEDYGGGTGYVLESNNRISGSGFDVKLGTIFRPIESSPLRIGLAVHTPVFYNLTYTTNAYLRSDLYFGDDAEPSATEVDSYAALGHRNMNRDFELRTPWLFNASLGYTVGNYLALDAEYEYEDYSSMKFRDDEGYEDTFEFENNEMGNKLKGVSTFRIGAEYKPISEFSLRAGYNYSTAAFEKDAFKSLAYNSINTDTDYSNSKSMNTFTLGVGYRFSAFYADLAYKYDTYKANFYAFDEADLQATKVTNTRSQVLFTLGVRF